MIQMTGAQVVPAKAKGGSDIVETDISSGASTIVDVRPQTDSTPKPTPKVINGVPVEAPVDRKLSRRVSFADDQGKTLNHIKFIDSRHAGKSKNRCCLILFGASIMRLSCDTLRALCS